MRSMTWHYAVGGQQVGPVSEDELNRLVNAGTVKADTLVWKEGWADWRAYGTAGLGGSAADSSDADTAVCVVSGRRLPKRDMLEFEGRWVSAEHKEEFFQRLREGVNLSNDMVYASFWRRFGAKIIDTVIVVAANMLVGAVLGGVAGGMGSGPGSGGWLAVQAIIQITGILIPLFFSIYFIRKYDATPGKKALGLKLVRADGTKLTKKRITGRHFAEYLSSFSLLIGYLMVAFDKEQRRALHDRIADTRVIDIRGR